MSLDWHRPVHFHTPLPNQVNLHMLPPHIVEELKFVCRTFSGKMASLLEVQSLISSDERLQIVISGKEIHIVFCETSEKLAQRLEQARNNGCNLDGITEVITAFKDRGNKSVCVDFLLLSFYEGGSARVH